ncbi:MAG: sugar transferase [Coriobacteriales bacterium]|nr:sugar transferase [Coriobacteriales bacterium]
MAVQTASGAACSHKRPGKYRYAKRALDIVASLVIIVVMAIPVLIVCIAISIESHGLPMFRQERVGRNGKPFLMFKLRTMYADAEGNMERYLTPEQMREWEAEHKVADDPRVTKIGRFLRRTSLDEIPQFMNVLVGQMSVIGPRPVTREELKWYGSDLDEILSVRQGVTGYWQAYARNDVTWESGERQEMELYYVRHMCASLDARIFFSTFGAIVGRTGK